MALEYVMDDAEPEHFTVSVRRGRMSLAGRPAEHYVDMDSCEYVVASTLPPSRELSRVIRLALDAGQAIARNGQHRVPLIGCTTNA